MIVSSRITCAGVSYDNKVKAKVVLDIATYDCLYARLMTRTHHTNDCVTKCDKVQESILLTEGIISTLIGH